MENHAHCLDALLPVGDALDVISGKWKLLILISISSGNHRFKDIERSIPKISAKVLSKELKELEVHTLIKRTIYDQTPVLIQYTLTPYTVTLFPLIEELRVWGLNHRKVIINQQKVR